MRSAASTSPRCPARTCGLQIPGALATSPDHRPAPSITRASARPAVVFSRTCCCSSATNSWRIFSLRRTSTRGPRRPMSARRRRTSTSGLPPSKQNARPSRRDGATIEPSHWSVMDRVNGLHHITAIAGPAQENLDFYAGVLGMRLVKRSVNQDDPGTYHLFYADAEGHPGSDLTFFPWAHLAPPRAG